MSTEKIYEATVRQITAHFTGKMCGERIRHLDIGSGSGDLVKRLRDKLDVTSNCCDYTDQLMQLPDQAVEIIDLNRQMKLPYANHSFDVVTATEVIEHLENFRALLREIYRVLKDDGLLVLTTPNILNLNSRLRNLWFGFAVLMGPLPIQDRNIESCFGHIAPVSLFYIMHALYECDFRKVRFAVDKYQRSAFLKVLLLWPLIKFFSAIIWHKEVNRYKTVDDSNREIVSALNSLPVLLGRTVVVSGLKSDRGIPG